MSKSPRKPVSAKIRFEVFKRDKFTCQYCGKSAPDVLLEIEHIKPVSKGGTNDLLNLLCACRECNQGKGKRELSDTAEIEKQKKQLEELGERRNQLQLMVKWREGLVELHKEEVNVAAQEFTRITGGWTLNENGVKNVSKLIKQYGLNEVITSWELAANQKEPNEVFDYGMRIMRCRKNYDPKLDPLFRLRSLIKKRFSHWENQTINAIFGLMKQAHFKRNVSIEDLTYVCTTVQNHDQLCRGICELDGGDENEA